MNKNVHFISGFQHKQHTPVTTSLKDRIHTQTGRLYNVEENTNLTEIKLEVVNDVILGTKMFKHKNREGAVTIEYDPQTIQTVKMFKIVLQKVQPNNEHDPKIIEITKHIQDNL